MIPANREWMRCWLCEQTPPPLRLPDCPLCRGHGGWYVSPLELGDQEDDPDPHEGRTPLTPRDPPSSDDPDSWDGEP